MHWIAFGIGKEIEKTLMATEQQKNMEDHANKFDDGAENGSPLIKLQHFCLLRNWKIDGRKKRVKLWRENRRIIGNITATHCANTNKCAQKGTQTRT